MPSIENVSSPSSSINANEDIFSVSHCLGSAFADYIPFWRHDGFWLFDSPAIIVEIARAQQLDLAQCRLFYYEVEERQFVASNRRWATFRPEASLPTRVVVPAGASLEGYDVVTFSAGSSPECSPLSCNGLASEIATNRHCLLPSVAAARHLLERGAFDRGEPGPFRIFAVYSLPWP